MNQLISILPWAALWALLTAAGTFIDKYHIRKNWVSIARTWLTAMFLFLDELPKKFENGSRVEIKLGKKGRIAQGITGFVLVILIIWWADNRAINLLGASEFNLAYWSAFVIGVIQGLFGGLLISLLIILVLGLLLAVTMLCLYLLRFLLMELLNVASDPQHSPFSYAGSLIGIGACLLKLLYEWAK